ncbi:hypothetical protein FA95DRAFT_1581138 [Auriscalpium vulgare]|uniref:Uncharacterized protein n=1 Tax=Auriscalpium vulgare TaxID=40419 RepID=A0ACB8S244_9AGAM|nr:hypothetical protein FA95DRAFT_1581138 [Auriscalpium vulgare]
MDEDELPLRGKPSTTPTPEVHSEPVAEGDGDAEEAEAEEEDESDEDIEFIMEPPTRSLDLRPNRPAAARNTSSTYTPNKSAPGPSLTTEYTPRERGTPVTRPSVSATPAPAPPAHPQQQPPVAIKTQSASTSPQPESVARTDDGLDPSTLPPVTAPPSHPAIDPTLPGTIDGRPVFEVDMANLAEKPWRRPGSDLSDWFNYGFDEISWDAYCYRRRDLGEVANVLKASVVNFAGMPEEQLAQLPPEIRTMVMVGTNAVLNNSGAGQMMGAPGMNVNAMMGPDVGNMNMQQMMNPMMVGMGGDMGMDGAPQAPQPDQMQGMQDGGFQQGYPQGPPQGPMGMPQEYMQAVKLIGRQDPAMQQQMYQQMEAPVAPTPVVPAANRGAVPFRGNRGMRGVRGAYAGRGRGGIPTAPRPASPLPPNVPTGPRNQNKYKDRDKDAQAVDGLDYGGGGGGGGGPDRGSGTPTGDHDERSR